jgi:hypothetical protein
MSFPETRELMQEAGYKRLYYTRCRGCRGPMEWWVTPNQKRIPMNPMAWPHSPAVSHFATCPKADDFRKQAKE